MPETNARIKVCHDTAANFKTNNPTLLVGEWALETDTQKMKIGDGSTAYNALPYSTAQADETWQKPNDWMDIRSGALPNSIYFLVGHSADYVSYPTFAVVATVSSGTYDVYVDGVKRATTASGTATELNWQTLALNTGYAVTYPSALQTHIVRITPTNGASKFTKCKLDVSSAHTGVLWVHFGLNYRIDVTDFAGSFSGTYYAQLLEAITAEGDVLQFSDGFNVKRAAYLQHLPVLEGNNHSSTSMGAAFSGCSLIKKIRIKNVTIKANSLFRDCASLKTIEGDNLYVKNSNYVFDNTPLLTQLPNLIFDGDLGSSFLRNATHLSPTLLEATSPLLRKLEVKGTADNRMNGLKGVLVSNEAPFDQSSPQLDVSYTGLNRAALVNLFHSMPYNVGYTVVGSPTITDGVVSGFSGDDFLQISLQVAPQNITEFVAKIKINAAAIGSGRYHNIFYGPSSSSLVLFGGEVGAQAITTVACYLPGAADSITWVTANLVADTWYWFKYTYDGTTVKLYFSTDGINYGAEKVSKTATINGNTGTRNIGNRWSGDSKYFDGEIDLNETYIKVNGIPWFTGKAAMTKTCSVVGCTGTADLTQDDKNIALNKGWSLTVA